MVVSFFLVLLIFCLVLRKGAAKNNVGQLSAIASDSPKDLNVGCQEERTWTMSCARRMPTQTWTTWVFDSPS